MQENRQEILSARVRYDPCIHPSLSLAAGQAVKAKQSKGCIIILTPQSRAKLVSLRTYVVSSCAALPANSIYTHSDAELQARQSCC